MYASVKNYNIQKYEKAGDDEGDLLPFLNNPFSAHCLVLIVVDCVLKKSCYRLSINVKKQTILS